MKNVKTKSMKLFSMLSLLAMAAMVGCQTTSSSSEPTTSDEPSEPRYSGVAPYGQSGEITYGKQMSAGGENFNSLAFSDGAASSPVVLEKVMPSEVAAGAPFSYKVHVHNKAGFAVHDVVVTEYVPSTMKFDSASPAPASSNDGKLVFKMDKLDANSHATITITGSTDEVGELGTCATVTYIPHVCVATKVVKPGLELTKSLPEEVLICDPIVMNMTVRNPGTGAVRNVRVNSELPTGLVTTDGKKTVSMTIPQLAPGESKDYTIAVKAEKTGKFTSKATAMGDGNLKSEASDTVMVVQPVLEIAKTGPERVFIGRNVTYTIQVENTGDATSANTVVTDVIDAKTQFVSASDGGTFEGGKVVWNLGSLAEGASRELSVTVKPMDKGRISNNASATGVCATAVSDAASTEIEGIPAVLLEVIDVTDPVAVGDTTVYVVTVTNQGSAVGTNIKIAVELEKENEFVSTGGATDGSHDDGKITFDALPTLAPGAKASWQITVRAKEAGDIRIKVNMTGDQIGRPVVETEATNFYE